MAIEDLPIWPFEPTWSKSVTETLEWLTDVLASPDGSEQRRTLRFFPRRLLEYQAIAEGDGRQLLDNLLITYGDSRWYLPIWYEVNLLDAGVASGASEVFSADARNAGLMTVGRVVCFVGDDPYTCELAEIVSVTSTSFITAAPLTRSWPAGSRVFPASIAELTDQPQLDLATSNAVSTEIRFRILDVQSGNPSGAGDLTDIYLTFYVMTMEPDYSKKMSKEYERNFVEIDNKTSTPERRDDAQRPFTLQQYSWSIVGRAQHRDFGRMLQALRGRAQPMWVPTFMDDFILADDITGGWSLLVVKRCGFTLAGGPRPDRQDIMIETVSGTRYYRRILSSEILGDNEGLTLDESMPVAHPMEDILRISFIALMRLNHDTVTIEHEVDTIGISDALVTFRSAPNTRNALSAFE